MRYVAALLVVSGFGAILADDNKKQVPVPKGDVDITSPDGSAPVENLFTAHGTVKPNTASVFGILIDPSNPENIVLGGAPRYHSQTQTMRSWEIDFDTTLVGSGVILRVDRVESPLASDQVVIELIPRTRVEPKPPAGTAKSSHKPPKPPHDTTLDIRWKSTTIGGGPAAIQGVSEPYGQPVYGLIFLETAPNQPVAGIPARPDPGRDWRIEFKHVPPGVHKVCVRTVNGTGGDVDELRVRN